MSFTWTAQQRADTIRAMRAQLTRLEQDDAALVTRCRRQLPDGYPAGHGGRSIRGNHADPTAQAANIRATITDDTSDAAKALTLLWKAAKLLEQADSARALALPPVIADPIDEEWCVSCMRIGTCTPRTPRKGGRQDLCSWCQDWYYTNSELPTTAVLDRHARGIRITTSASPRILTPINRRSA